MIEPLLRTFTVACARPQAFALWTEQATLWWPRSHKMSRDPAASVVFEPRVGGRVFERASDGREVDWGEILAWEPPERIAYWWHIGTDRSRATQVEIGFAALGDDRTEIHIRHSGWEQLGGQGPDWRKRNDGGWAGVLEAYRLACGAPGAAAPQPDRRTAQGQGS